MGLIIFSNIFISYAFDTEEEKHTEIKYTPPKTSPGLMPADGTLFEAFRDGKMTLNLLPHYLIYLIDLFSKLAGTVAVTAILFGGFQYVVSGVTEEKESAKNTLKYATIGLAVTLDCGEYVADLFDGGRVISPLAFLENKQYKIRIA